MKKRFMSLKTSVFLLQLFSLIAVQLLIIPWRTFYIYAFLNVFLFVVIYSFRGYEIDILSSLSSCFISYILGSFFAHLVMLLIALLTSVSFSQKMFLVSFLLSAIYFPIISNILWNIQFKKIKPQYYLVVGKSERIKAIMAEIEKASLGKIRVYAYTNPHTVAMEEKIKLSAVIDKLLIADPSLEPQAQDLIMQARQNGKRVIYLPHLAEDTLKRIPVELLELFEEYYKAVFQREYMPSPAKRILDIAGSIVGLVLFSPLVILISICILLEDGLPVIFRQKRIGLNLEPFTIHKFRTMKGENKEAKLASQEVHRMMKISKWMRPFRLDEIPQFYDILIGKMSIVGPRPEQPEFVDRYSALIPFYNYRHNIKPGLTGWAQINYPYSETIEETRVKLSYDLWYVKNRNILIDLKIILQTLYTVFFKKGGR